MHTVAHQFEFKSNSDWEESYSRTWEVNVSVCPFASLKWSHYHIFLPPPPKESHTGHAFSLHPEMNLRVNQRRIAKSGKVLLVCVQRHSVTPAGQSKALLDNFSKKLPDFSLEKLRAAIIQFGDLFPLFVSVISGFLPYNLCTLCYERRENF